MEEIWIYSALGGLIPALFWLFFWMRQDAHEKEPKKLILKIFIFGAFSAFFAIFFQIIASEFNLGRNNEVWVFSFIEEFVKFFAVFVIALGSVWNNERGDPIIYMITAALGFVFIENTFYIFNYLNDFRYLELLIDGSYRFIGASLLHVVASSVVGIFIALVFFKSLKVRVTMAFLGLIAATSIHVLFNFLLMTNDPFYSSLAFYGVWTLAILLIVFLSVINRKESYRLKKNGKIYKIRKNNGKTDCDKK